MQAECRYDNDTTNEWMKFRLLPLDIQRLVLEKLKEGQIKTGQEVDALPDTHVALT